MANPGRAAVLACLAVAFLFVASCLHLLLAENRPVTARIYPQIVMRGADLRLTCRVEPNTANRWLDYGIADYVNSERQLDGDKARVTWEAPFAKIPCDVGPAYCVITRAGGWQSRAIADFQIVGCE